MTFPLAALAWNNGSNCQIQIAAKGGNTMRLGAMFMQLFDVTQINGTLYFEVNPNLGEVGYTYIGSNYIY